MADLQPISMKQWRATIDGVQAYFTKVTAPKETFGETEYSDGQTGQTLTHTDFIKIEKVTLSKPYDPVGDKALVDLYINYKKKRELKTISLEPTNADLERTKISGAPTIVLNQCQITSFTWPEIDHTGTGMSMLVMEVVPKTIDTQ